ncbi:MAG: ECF transporter S component [Ruminiclostridium sp.]|nr:ECF transporter S component [Ruminiclostridium sp.]
MTAKTSATPKVHTERIRSVRFLTLTAILTAISVILQYLEFPVPFFIPSFVKFDFSDLPAILATFLVSPISGVTVCLLKNLIHIAVSQSAGVGELCNFLLGAVMVIPAWFIYKVKPTKTTALIAMIAGSVIVAAASIFINYYITYPFYESFYGLPMDAIIGMYRELNGGVGSLWDALIWFNMPFTFAKFMIDSVIVFFIYKPLAKAIRRKD